MDKQLLKDALDIRIPKVQDKSNAYTMLQKHVSDGNLSEYDAQRYTDILYPAKYEIELDEDGVEVPVEVTPRTIFTLDDYVPEPSETDLLHAQVKASSDYVDLLEEVVVELIQEVYK